MEWWGTAVVGVLVTEVVTVVVTAVVGVPVKVVVTVEVVEATGMGEVEMVVTEVVEDTLTTTNPKVVEELAGACSESPRSTNRYESEPETISDIPDTEQVTMKKVVINQEVVDAARTQTQTNPVRNRRTKSPNARQNINAVRDGRDGQSGVIQAQEYPTRDGKIRHRVVNRCSAHSVSVEL